VLSEEEFMDAHALRRQGYSYAQIARALGRDWRTVKRYLEEGAQPVYRRRRAPSKLDPHKHRIDQWLAREPGLLATRIHQDLVRDYGFAGDYQTVRRYVARARPRPAAALEERFETAPGHQAQVDWSHESPILTASGIALPLYGFHMVLGHSRDAFVGFCASMDLATFWGCHRAAFAHFGGVPREILYDRTKTVVLRHVGRERGLQGEAVFHPEALAMAHHYGFRIRLCRPFRAKTKGKVERDVPFVRERLVRGHAWRDHDQANREWQRWNDDVARRRVHATHGEVVAVRAERDRAALGALPARPYVVVVRALRVVGRDGLVSYEGRRYPVRAARPGERVQITLGADELEVRRIADGTLVARHRRGAPARVLADPDPTAGSVALAAVLCAHPDPELHARPLSVYEEAAGG
jgi:transposase